MVINRSEMKRKRKEECSSPLLDDIPKRTKVHAQRKFAQGSNVNSPVITPVKEIEKQEIDVLPEPVELLPIKRPNTEDFLTFLCFRGTPILPPSLNFFNTASIVDTNGQVHEIKSESPKNGPIDTSAIAKTGSGSSERPFVAFGVRKRADPIVISRQMDKKRRHALALQALRRKYQEQRMAKIRAVTISKLSEKVTSKTLVRSNSISKSESGSKKNTVIKTKIPIKEAPVSAIPTTRSVKSAVRPQIKQKMCLRSFRGRFVQRELQFRNVKKRPMPPPNKLAKNKKKPVATESDESESEYSSDDEKPLLKTRNSQKVDLPKIAKKSAPGPKKPSEIKITRSNKFLSTKAVSRRQQIKQRMLLSTPKTIVKPRMLRSQTAQKKLFTELPKKKIIQIKKETPRRLPALLKKSAKVTENIKTKPANNPRKLLRKVVKIIKKEISSKTTTNKEKPIDKAKKTKLNVKDSKISPPSESQTKKETTNIKKKVVETLKKSGSKMIDNFVKKDKESQKLIEEDSSAIETRTSQRPTRKTKEAAAIYMEILSHKLVSESKIDDDNVSIDSFPELPNVKKTEQRENELKAKAKCGKETDGPTESKKIIPPKETRKKPPIVKNIKEIEKPAKEHQDTKKITVKEEIKKIKVAEKVKEIEVKVHVKQVDSALKKQKLGSNESSNRETSPKRSKIKSSDDKNNEPEITKRQTRNSAQNIRHTASDDSDESFRADIRIPRKKQITRGKVFQCYESDLEDSAVSDNNICAKKSLRTNTRSYKEHSSSSDSDQSTTTDVNVKIPKVTNKNKKFSKIRNQQKTDQSFSDSDEEPLSKLTLNKKTESKEITMVKVETEVKTNEKIEEKPKRECAKRPQNYLPMFSSSDEEDNYMVRIKSDNTSKTSTKIPKNQDVGCSHPSTSLDLSCKDIGRRFGKGKVNMSNEQIEKWLKESAMAGNTAENEEMLKFGEKIPTETSYSVANAIDTEKLKTMLFTIVDKVEDLEKKNDISPKTMIEDSIVLSKLMMKPTMIDRKLIFRTKTKINSAPNTSAFSASNESSVYAFGEDEDVMKTPFRRPVRRPSSTATSRSEDESSKYEESGKTGQFRKPPSIKQESTKSASLIDEIQVEAEDLTTQTQKTISNKTKMALMEKCEKKTTPSTSAMDPPVQKTVTLKPPIKQNTRDSSDDFKYKVPSSPSASSSSSAKLYKRQNSKSKFRLAEILPVKLTEFPTSGNGQLVEAPTFCPTEKEFQDPLEYIEKIRSKAEQFGICRIVPPSTFKPECKVTDDMRFTAYNQYVHKMLHRWGPNFKELMAIKKYLSTQNISLTHPPWIGGMEIDLPRLYQTVQSLGGLKEVIEKKKWPKVSEAMKIPKSAQDRVTKLDDIYCKYLLPYDTLSPAEREKLFDEVETDWAKRESKSLLKAQQNINDNSHNEMESESDDNEVEECIVKGRSMALNAFYRIARNTMSMWFKTSEPSASEVEQEFWKHVTIKQNHICVHSGSIDSGNWGYGFAVTKNSPFARHAWNLKVLTNNSGSVLRSMGPIMGVTVPTLHVGMVFSSCCWYRDPHSLPWIEYLHTGGNKIWYGIPNSTSASFHAALKTLVPNYCRNKSLWLPSDTVMVPPNLLIENGVSLSRIVQEPGQFIIVFPKVFTSSLSTGYVVSESVYFAPPYWLKSARFVFDELRNSCESSMFSMDRLLLSIINDARSSVEVLKQIIPAVQELCDKEKLAREKIRNLGVTGVEKLPLPEAPNVRKKKKLMDDDGEYECEICRMNLFISMVIESQDDEVYCLDHAAEFLEKKKIQSKHCKLSYTYDDKELEGLMEKINGAITNKIQKKIPNKYTGMPTLLTK